MHFAEPKRKSVAECKAIASGDPASEALNNGEENCWVHLSPIIVQWRLINGGPISSAVYLCSRLTNGKQGNPVKSFKLAAQSICSNWKDAATIELMLENVFTLFTYTRWTSLSSLKSIEIFHHFGNVLPGPLVAIQLDLNWARPVTSGISQVISGANVAELQDFFQQWDISTWCPRKVSLTKTQCPAYHLGGKGLGSRLPNPSWNIGIQWTQGPAILLE